MKYAVLIGDGMSDVPLDKLGGKTPLEVANIPHMNLIAKEGLTGWARTIPKDMPPGSDVACMSIFGYDPEKYYTGRGPFEAASRSIDLKNNDVAFRCNLVTIKDGIMDSFTADHISSEEAKILIEFINQKLGGPKIKFYPGVMYRHLCIIEDGPLSAECVPPHDITDRKIEAYLPKGKGSELLKRLMEDSIPLLRDHEVNKKRIAQGKKPATQIWLWGQGKKPTLPTFRQKYGISGSVITAVDIIKGIGRIAGLEIIDVPGATGYYDTNYKGKGEYALSSIKERDFVLVHVESPDEAGHTGDIENKIKAIENFDKFIVGPVLEGLKMMGDFRILSMPDHPTPCTIKTHSSEPVPFAMMGQGIKKDEIQEYNEKAIAKSKLFIEHGYTLLDRLILW